MTEGEGAAKVTIEMEDEGLRSRRTRSSIRPRIFLEGNFVDLQPGTPARRSRQGRNHPGYPDGCAGAARRRPHRAQRDTRTDLQTFLREYSDGLADGGAEGFNESIRWWEPAYRNSSLANDATLGQDADRDLQRVLSGQQKTFAALAEDGVRSRTACELQRRGRRAGRGRGAGPRSRAARHAAGGTARARVAQHGAAVASPLRERRPSGRAHPTRRWTPRCRSSARRGCSCRGAARERTRTARQTIPDVVGFNGVSIPFLEQARALGLHEQGARALPGPRGPEPPRRATTTRRSGHSCSAASQASRVRAGSLRTETTSTSMPARVRPATACVPARRPTA